jgi:hypothetical protein
MKRLVKSKSKATPVQAPIVADDYPTLSEFFSAYLHQQRIWLADESRETLRCRRVAR